MSVKLLVSRNWSTHVYKQNLFHTFRALAEHLQSEATLTWIDQKLKKQPKQIISESFCVDRHTYE